MNNQEKYNEDLLRRFIKPESIEKAPEDFTNKVMSLIELEKVPSLSVTGKGVRNYVPVISIAVTILLLAAAYMIPSTDKDQLTLPVLTFITYLKSYLPEVNLSSVSDINLPSVLMYIFIGILVLTFFDRALYGLFHREK
jgi:hypothetical protein